MRINARSSAFGVRQWLMIGAVCIAALLIATPGRAQMLIAAPVTALWSDGSRLLIGNGTRLLEASLTPDSDEVKIAQSVDLGRTNIRAIGVSSGNVLALTEDGLTSLSADLKIMAFIAGGGQRMVVSGDRVYVAAVKAGVRIVRVTPSGQLSREGAFSTSGSALDLALDSATPGRVWVAEDVAGVKLYDSVAGKAVLAINGVVAAGVVRISGTRLYVGHAGTLSVFDLAGVSPRLLNTFPLEDAPPKTLDPVATVDSGANAVGASSISDLWVVGNRVYVGWNAPNGGPDVIALTVGADGSAKISGKVGERGSGERLTLRGDDVFIGAEQFGLERARFSRGQFQLLVPWTTTNTAGGCVAAAPTNPTPPNLVTAGDNPLTLSWRSACASAFEVRINGKLAAQIDAARALATPDPDSTGKLAYAYTFSPSPGAVTWQITAIDAAGRRIDGPVWRFEAYPQRWAATPMPIPRENLVYQPFVLIDPTSPGTAIAVISGGLVVIIVAGWWLGTLSERRERQRLKTLEADAASYRARRGEPDEAARKE